MQANAQLGHKQVASTTKLQTVNGEETHLEHLDIVFKRLDTYDVSINGKKCHILRQSVDYLGFALASEEILEKINQCSKLPSQRRKGIMSLPQGSQLLQRHGA